MDQDGGIRDHEARTQEPSGVFSFEGRITPRRFMLLTLAPYAFMFVAWGLSRGQMRGGGPASSSLAALSAIAVAWISLASHAKRWHDLGKSGWRALLQMFPLVNFIAWLYLALTKGQDGPNQYGDPPED